MTNNQLLSFLCLMFTTSGKSDGLLQNELLTKRYTIRIPMIAPVGGKINPMGDICTESVDMLLKKVNNQREILPDYNLVIDLIDDECSDAVAIRRLLPELLDWKRSVPNILAYDNTANNNNTTYRLPLNALIKSNNTTAYTPPLLVGGICSSACKVTGRLPQHFGLINIANACIDPALDNRQRYPNFYRLYRSVRETTYARISLAKTMGWSSIAILSDTTQYSYQDSVYFMKTLAAEHQMAIVAEEFFQDDPTEAIQRLKSVDARIIFAICYVNVCPAIACAAYQQNYYGANVVWIFNSDVDLTSRKINRPPGCDPAMTDAFVEANLFIGIDLTASTASKEQRSQIGISAKEVTDYIREKSPNALSTSANEWRLLCYELAHNAAFIVDKVERQLRAGNNRSETLMEVILDTRRGVELREMFRSAALTLDIQASWGRSTQRLNSTILPFAYQSPVMMVQQVQQLTRRPVMIQLHPLEKYKSLNNDSNFVWKTSTGKAPRSEARIVNFRLQLSPIAVNILRVIVSILICATIGCVVVMIHLHDQGGRGGDNKYSKFVDCFPQMNALILAGSCLPLLAVALFPSSNDDIKMDAFCYASPILIVIGFSLTLGGLSVKVWTCYIYCISGRISQLRRCQGNSIALLLIWCLINSALLIGLYEMPDARPKSVTMITSNNSVKAAFSDEIVNYLWETCSSSDFTIGYVVITLQLLSALTGVLMPLLTKYSYSVSVVTISDIGATKNCIYILLPIAIALLLTMATIYNDCSQFALLTVYAVSQNVVLVFMLFVWKLLRRGRHSTSPSKTMIGSSTAHPQSKLRSKSPAPIINRPHLRRKSISAGNLIGLVLLQKTNSISGTATTNNVEKSLI